ncbi:M16 family metallopeptidase [Gallionella capsiferriformans]|uniref:Peptidase M16 domain protein n=1 Tax=Gallionella capsiferriformans (strain ES-2) TaxID=395494 RepID=D9SC41_GALCS|nr:pitrilysin family protein [Gallionella capsiferriformans]ADL54506.1 peptidase M16 domain protein [Gallionella capsiferriformans ES-2]
MRNFLFGVALLATGLQPAVGAEVFEKTLANGLKVIVREDHRAPVLVQQIWYKAGSMDELTGKTGVAHVLEHLMFKGTKSVPAGEFSRRIAAAGGRENAFTSNDYTAYFQQLHKSKLPLAMKLEADRMHNLDLSAAEFAKEIKVVMEERRMRTDDEPHALLQEKMTAAVYVEHPYQHPVIGWMSDLEQMTVADARDWYKKWYAPNNATLVVAGDVAAPAVFALAERYYGSIPKQLQPPRRVYTEPVQLGIKRMVVKAPAELPLLVMSFHAPNIIDPKQDWKPYALEMLAGVLSGNDSARLNKHLVREQQVASSVAAGYDSASRGPGVFTLEATPSEGRSIVQMEAALRAEIEQLIKDGVSAEELQRVRAQVLAGEVYKLDSVFYQAMQIGQMESIGLGYRSIPVMLEKLQAVTAEQVSEVAREFLQDDNLTVAVLDPQPLSGKPKQTGALHVH